MYFRIVSCKDTECLRHTQRNFLYFLHHSKNFSKLWSSGSGKSIPNSINENALILSKNCVNWFLLNSDVPWVTIRTPIGVSVGHVKNIVAKVDFNSSAVWPVWSAIHLNHNHNKSFWDMLRLDDLALMVTKYTPSARSFTDERRRFKSASPLVLLIVTTTVFRLVVWFPLFCPPIAMCWQAPTHQHQSRPIGRYRP